MDDTVLNWPTDFDQARQIQETLAPQIITRDAFPPVTHIAGTDVGFEDDGRTARAAIAVLAYPSLQLVDHVIAKEPTRFPYVPGFLSFREVPVLLKALERVKVQPQLLLCDGAGIAHPRRFGLACHLGLLSGIASIGVAKSRLVGTHATVGEAKGSRQPLVYHGQVLGTVLRTRDRIAPLYISPGHRVSLESAVHWVLACTTRYRLPETTRWAHRLASEWKGERGAALESQLLHQH